MKNLHFFKGGRIYGVIIYCLFFAGFAVCFEGCKSNESPERKIVQTRKSPTEMETLQMMMDMKERYEAMANAEDDQNYPLKEGQPHNLPPLPPAINLTTPSGGLKLPPALNLQTLSSSEFKEKLNKAQTLLRNSKEEEAKVLLKKVAANSLSVDEKKSVFMLLGDALLSRGHVKDAKAKYQVAGGCGSNLLKRELKFRMQYVKWLKS